MDSEIQILQTRFDERVQSVPEDNIEFWFARDLQEPLGYARWENFLTAIQRAIDACQSTGYSTEDHFRGVTKMVPLGSGAERPIDDFMLTRYACYLVAMNGDPRKAPIAFAQSYFATQTRKQEIIEERMKLQARSRPPARENGHHGRACTKQPQRAGHAGPTRHPSRAVAGRRRHQKAGATRPVRRQEA